MPLPSPRVLLNFLDMMRGKTELSAGYDRTVHSLEAIGDAVAGVGSPASTWDAPAASHDTEDTFGNIVNDLTEESGGVYRLTAAALAEGPGGDATEAKEDIIINDVAATHVHAAAADVSLADGGFTNLLIDAIKAKTDTISPSDLSVPAADSIDNVDVTDVVGNKTDTANLTVGTGSSLMRYIKGLLSLHLVPTADATTNVYVRDVIGIKTDAAVTAVGTTKTLMAYLKGALNWLNNHQPILELTGSCDSGMSASKTAIVSAELIGYGNDFFNNKYFMEIITNNNSVGNAPEREVRQITDYVSTSGTFTVAAFSANVEASDELLIIHESQIHNRKEPMYGKCNADMGASATSIVIGNLAGFGDDFFNNKYAMVVLKNANSVGNAPETQTRPITDYATATGTFTVTAFTANVEASDEVLIIPYGMLNSGSAITVTQDSAMGTGTPDVVGVDAHASYNTFGSWAQTDASAAVDCWIGTVAILPTNAAHIVIEIGTGGAGAEVAKMRLTVLKTNASSVVVPQVYTISPPVKILSGTRVAAHVSSASGGEGSTFSVAIHYNVGLQQ